MSVDFSRASKVASIAEEYQHLRQQRCACGGRYRLVRQALVEDAAGRPYDRLFARCQSCGQPLELLFDVSAFYGHHPQGL